MGDAKIQLEEIHSKQEHTPTQVGAGTKSPLPHNIPLPQKRLMWPWKRNVLFISITMATATLSLQGTCPPGLHLPASSKSGPAALVPCHWAHFTNKGANSASWLHDMDTCPLSIGREIGDFHKGQPTAGRQAPPGHCHPVLNWRQRLSVTQHSSLPWCFTFSSRSLLMGGPCGWRCLSWLFLLFL